MDKWVVVSEKTKDHWLEVRDPEGWWEAYVKWDGCIGLTSASNIPLGEEIGAPEHMVLRDYLHICELDDFIERLQELKKKALEHFKGDWPG